MENNSSSSEGEFIEYQNLAGFNVKLDEEIK